MLFVRLLVFLFSLTEQLLLLGLGTGAQQLHGRIVYSWDQLIALRPAGLLVRTLEIPTEIWRKAYRRCRRGQKKQRKMDLSRQWRLMEKRRYKPCLPSIIMGNVRSLANKAIELTALFGVRGSIRTAVWCALWRHGCTRTYVTTMSPSVPFRLFRPTRIPSSGKCKGGGLAVLINNRWCNPGHINIKKWICFLDVELLAVGLRPYYLYRELSHIIIIAVCFPPPPTQHWQGMLFTPP